MKIGFIGCGNMASAIIKGIIKNKFISSECIYAYDIQEAALKSANEKYGINICLTQKAVVNCCDTVVLAVKPNVIAGVLSQISSALDEKNPLVISIAAGKTINYLESCLENNHRIIRVMPNINAQVCESMSAYCANAYATDDDKMLVCEMLNSIGNLIELPESSFALFGVLGGCAPAYSYMFIDALARAGVKNGMKKCDAIKIAAQTVYGSAKMILESDEHPWQLIDNVCSPGGTTIEGIASLQSDGFEMAVHNAVDKALDKDNRL